MQAAICTHQPVCVPGTLPSPGTASEPLTVLSGKPSPASTHPTPLTTLPITPRTPFSLSHSSLFPQIFPFWFPIQQVRNLGILTPVLTTRKKLNNWRINSPPKIHQRFEATRQTAAPKTGETEQLFKKYNLKKIDIGRNRKSV